jgi:hypothetical protein
MTKSVFSDYFQASRVVWPSIGNAPATRQSYWITVNQEAAADAAQASGDRAEREEQGLLRLLRAGINPYAFANDVLGFIPDVHQRRILERAPQFRQIGLNCSRQWGKSTVGAILALWRTLMFPGSTVLIIGPSGRQSGETLNKVRQLLAPLHLRTRTDGVNRKSILMPNGSRVIGLPAREDTVRGFSSVSMLIIDEASRVPDEVYLALRPSLAVSHGDILLLSTPRGRRGFFYREMTEADAKQQWLRHTGKVTECERIPEDFLEKERSRGEAYYKQEYLCEFVESGRYLFDEAMVNGMETPGLEAWRWLCR